MIPPYVAGAKLVRLIWVNRRLWQAELCGKSLPHGCATKPARRDLPAAPVYILRKASDGV